MKLSTLLLLFLVSSLNHTGSAQVDSAYIEFIPQMSQSNNEGIIYAANGHYKLSPNTSYKSRIPGMVRVNPESLVYEDSLFTVASHSSMSKLESYKYPLNYYMEITEFVYNDLIAVYEGSSDRELSIDELRLKRGLKFQDISDHNKDKFFL